jgi:hypothetical protein
MFSEQIAWYNKKFYTQQKPCKPSESDNSSTEIKFDKVNFHVFEKKQQIIKL